MWVYGDNVIFVSLCYVCDINFVCVGFDSFGLGYVDDIYVFLEDLVIVGDIGCEGCFCVVWRCIKCFKWYIIIEDNVDSLVMNVDFVKSWFVLMFFVRWIWVDIDDGVVVGLICYLYVEGFRWNLFRWIVDNVVNLSCLVCVCFIWEFDDG